MDERNDSGLLLLNKKRGGLWAILFSRLGLVVILLIMQLGLIFSFFVHFREFSSHYYAVNTILSAVVFFNVINSDNDPTAKITWMVVIAILPVFGSVLYWYTKNDIGFNALKYQLAKILQSTDKRIKQDADTFAELDKESRETALLAKYIAANGCHPVYSGTDVTYFPVGEDKFRRMLTELEKAEKFIFLEYFIIDEGVMWGKILQILARKAKQGVEVMVMYDGSNEFTTLPRDYSHRLAKLGIKCKVFAPATPFVSTHYNYRDHRKILVIDGHTAFTGGVNLADEYINGYEKYGHWKDAAIMLKGPAAKSFSLMFLQMWNISGHQVEYEKYLSVSPATFETDSYVIPYGDSPVDNEKVGKQVYMDIINRANNYVYIMSPYLILDGDLENRLRFAAARGVDVRIILPGIPDKITPYALAKTHYHSLISSGVKIYEYQPGFVHSKVFVSDDIKAVVGTINLDYRSLYHHFECAAYLYKCECIPDIVKDFVQTQQLCRQITFETIKNEKLFMRTLGRVMKILAPLM